MYNDTAMIVDDVIVLASYTCLDHSSSEFPTIMTCVCPIFKHFNMYQLTRT